MVSNLISMMSSMRSSDDLLATCCELIFIFSSKISISPERVLKTTQALAFCFFRFLHSGKNLTCSLCYPLRFICDNNDNKVKEVIKCAYFLKIVGGKCKISLKIVLT